MSQGEGKIAVVPGANGFMAAHVVDQLVKKGFQVRGTVRSSRLASAKKSFADAYAEKVEITAVDDLVKGDFTEIFKGAHVLIHTASPLIGREATPEAALDVSIEGSLNIIRQGYNAGVRNIVFCSSVSAHSNKFFRGDYSKVTEDEWQPITREQVLAQENPDVRFVYQAQKVLSEQAVWKWAEEHPDAEVATVSPTYFFGPFAPGQKTPFEGEEFSANNISTMHFFRQLLLPDGTLPQFLWIDVRDVASTHVEALFASPTAQVGRKRFLVSGEWHHPREIADLIIRERPAFANRINKNVDSAPHMGQVVFNDRVNELLGFKLIPWKQTILDSTDQIAALEKFWADKGKPIYGGESA